MVGIVIVSHSRALAEGLVQLVKQVASEELPIAFAAGVGPDNQEFGTNAVEIMESILAVDSPQGVLILMDLGSAILSAEMALELLPAEMHSRIRFCPAPLVEGAIAAGIQSSLGSNLDQVFNEAAGALHPKQEQLGEKIQTEQRNPAYLPNNDRLWRLLPKPGLHCRTSMGYMLARQLASYRWLLLLMLKSRY
jgi:dihydroxyacetone kinase phosphotransfer subunit